MSLTMGNAPFGKTPRGVFNFRPDAPRVIYFEDYGRRIRGMLGGETVVDSTDVKLLHEAGHLPVCYFPESDVRQDLLQPTDHTTHCPYKGDASYSSVRVGERLAENAVWSYPEPIEGAPPLAGYQAFVWKALDEWLEEDEPAPVHPRDPYHRVDALDSARSVRVSVDGEVLAETTRAKVLYETGLPPRWYIPADDVRTERLEPSDTVSRCPYKGQAAYRSVAGSRRGKDLVWLYDDPRPEVAKIRGLLCFYNERVDLEVDGTPQERPHSPLG